MNFKDTYEVGLLCDCNPCELGTTHIVDVYTDGYVEDVAFARCDICGDIKKYTEKELLKICIV